MLIPMLSLGVGAVIFGYLSHDIYLNQGQNTGSVLFTLPSHFMEGLLDLNSYMLTGSHLLGFLPMFTLLCFLFLIPVVSSASSSSSSSSNTYSESVSSVNKAYSTQGNRSELNN